MPGSRPVALGGTGLSAIAELARRRSTGWAALAETFAAPTPAWVAAVREGRVRQSWEDAVGWRTGELEGFGPPLLVLGSFERSSRRRELDHDIATLSEAFDASDDGSFDAALAACELLHRLCSDEASAWSAGQLPKARALRVHQHDELHADAGEALGAGCAAMLATQPRQPYLALTQVGRLWVDRERGGSSFVNEPQR